MLSIAVDRLNNARSKPFSGPDSGAPLVAGELGVPGVARVVGEALAATEPGLEDGVGMPTELGFSPEPHPANADAPSIAAAARPAARRSISLPPC